MTRPLKPVRVAVVGVGALGQHHARIYAEIPEADLVSVVDTRADRARSVAERFGCSYHDHLGALFGPVEAVSLAVPTQLHAAIGVELLRNGVHVLVEKPIAADLEGADALISAAEESGAILHVGHTERFNPAFTAVREMITTPQFFESHRLGVFVPRSLDIDVVLDLMIHDLDLILHMVQEPIREIRAVGIPVLTPRIDIANARIEFEGGCVANITASRVSKERIRKLRFFQPHDYISIDFHEQNAEVYSLQEVAGAKRILPRQLRIQHQEPLRLEIQSFLRAVTIPEVQAIGCSGAEGKLALALAMRVLSEMEVQRSGGDP